MKFYLLLTCIALATFVSAQPGALDKSFNPYDKGYKNGVGAKPSDVKALAIQPDGKILIGGWMDSYNGTKRRGLFRIHPDGAVDTTFLPQFINNVRAVALQPDGKIVIGGLPHTVDTLTFNYIARLLPNGRVDTTFKIGTGFNNEIKTLAIQPDGKIITGGNFTSYNGVSAWRVARLNIDGSIDTTFFKFIIGDNGYVNHLEILNNGKILVGGNFYWMRYPLFTKAYNILLLNNDGTTDTTFQVGTGFNAEVNAIAISQSGKIAVGGAFTNYNGNTVGTVVKLFPNGTIDPSFNVTSNSGSAVTNCLFLSNDRLLIAGTFNTVNGIMRWSTARLSSTGVVDSFYAGVQAKPYIYKHALQQDGSFLIAGNFSKINGRLQGGIAKLDTSGNPDFLFNSGAGANNNIEHVVTQPDGKIIIAGLFDAYNGFYQPSLIRLLTNGEVDSSYLVTLPSNSLIGTTALQQDGKLLVAGFHGPFLNQPLFIRLHPDGSVDTSFKTGTGQGDKNVYAIAIHQNGKIVVGGSFLSFNGQPKTMGVARLNTDGSVDPTFDAGMLSTNIYAIAIQNDSKIVIGGNFNKNIKRVLYSGAEDATFLSGSGFNGTVRTLKAQSDGKILATGNFYSYNGAAKAYIGRINNNGTLDNTFTATLGTNQTSISSIQIQGDGSYIFASTYAYPTNCVARLLPTGAVDTSFNIGLGPDQQPTGLSIQPDGKLIVVGHFSIFNGAARNRIARLFTRPAVVYTFNGNGNWSDAANWVSGALPPNPIPAGVIVNITPAAGGSCTFNGIFYISAFATLNVPVGSIFNIIGNMVVQ